MVGTGVDIYIIADGIEYDNKEFVGRAFDGGFKSRRQCSTKYGTQLAALAVGKYSGVAKNSHVYRYICTSYNMYTSY